MMVSRYGRWLVMALLGVWLAGCSSPPASRGSAAARDPSGSTVNSATNRSLPEVNTNLVTAHAHYLMGMLQELDEDPDGAQQELSKAALEDPGNSELVLELTRRFVQQKQPERALELLVRATAVPDARGELFARLGLVYSQLGKDEQAVEACATAIKRAPDLLDGYRTLFYIQLRRGHPKEALKALNLALKVQNPSPEFGIELAELYVALEKQAPSEKSAIDTNALAVLNRAASQNPASAQLRLKLADDYEDLGDLTNATKIYLQLLDTYRDLPGFRADLRDKLARIYLSQGNYSKATEELQGIVQDDPGNAEAYYLLGTLAEEEKKLPDAADYYEKTVLLSDTREPAYYDLARVQINLDRPREAVATLERARKKFTLGFQGEFLSALAFEGEKDYTNALKCLTAAEVIAKTTEPKRLNGDFYFTQGAAYERAGNYDDAERCFEKSLQLAPDSAEALNYLGYMWADRGVKLDKARDLIEKAVKLEPQSAAYLDSLGWVLYKLDRPQEALGHIQKAIELSPDPDPTLYEHLGDIYAALKQTDKAREAWGKSLAVEPNEPLRKKLEDASGKTAH